MIRFIFIGDDIDETGEPGNTEFAIYDTVTCKFHTDSFGSQTWDDLKDFQDGHVDTAGDQFYERCCDIIRGNLETQNAYSIPKDDLEEFGMEFDGMPMFPMKKILYDVPEDGESVMIVLTIQNNVDQLALVMGNGDMLILGGIKTLHQLKQFERSITEYIPNY